MSQFTERRARKQHEIERNFVRMPHRLPAPTRNRSSIQLPQFHGVSFRIIGKHRRSVYHQLDGSIELADRCTCVVHFGGGWGEMRIERVSDCLIDEHRIARHRENMGDVA